MAQFKHKRWGDIVTVEDGKVIDMPARFLTDEWEECETRYWFINPEGEIGDISIEADGPEGVNASRAIGNYFSSKEEAELAVRKLKAWKRLKDKGFRFIGWNRRYCDEINYQLDTTEDMSKDLDLLFSGGEK